LWPSLEIPSPAELQARLEAERAGDAFVVLRDDAGAQRIITLDPVATRITIGRSSAADIRLSWEREASRLHAELVFFSGVWTLSDNGLSRNGTFVGGEKVRGQRRLRDGDEILVGTTRIVFRSPSSDAESATGVDTLHPGDEQAPPISDAQRRVAIALCRPFAENDPFARPASNQEIARELVLSVVTVKTHLRALFQLFRLEDLPQNQKRLQLVEVLLRSGMVSGREIAGAEHRTGRLLTGGYRLGPEAARGATASVHRAYAADGSIVAAKRLLDDRHATRQVIEARLLRVLDHPRVVKVLGLVEDASGRYLIMEWVEGQNLAEVAAREGPLSADRVLEWVFEAADGLAYVHEQQTVHRDVKPQNLMLSDELGIVVVDFGIAQSFASRGASESGTPGFMAPEAYSGGAITPRTDVYGLAASAWALIAGAPPRLGAPDPLPGATPAVAAALRAALTVDPRERTASMAAFAAALGGRIEARGRDMTVTRDADVSLRPLLQSVVRAASGMLDAATVSLALVQPDESLLYIAAWGAGSDSVVDGELDPGRRIIDRAVRTNRPQLVQDVQSDPDWDAATAARTGYVPNTMLVVPIGTGPVGAVSLCDRRDGLPFDLDDLRRAQLFAELALESLTSGSDQRP
jgi:serine/threonine protein kinase